MPPAVVVASPLVIRLTEWDEYTGVFEATDTVDVRARVDGYLDSTHFRDGAIVKLGDLLFVIDPRPHEAALLEGARADVVRAQTRLELATTDFTRGEAIFAIKGIARKSSTPGRRRGRKPRRCRDRRSRHRAHGGAERGIHAGALRSVADLAEIRERGQRDLGRPGRIDAVDDDRRGRSDPVRVDASEADYPNLQPHERQRRTTDLA
jgi:hypothetical protein